jgi:phosphate transport system permease protein
MLPTRSRIWLKPGAEVFFLVPIALLGGWLAISLGGLFEGVIFGGDYRSWLLRVLGLTYDQRNSLVASRWGSPSFRSSSPLPRIRCRTSRNT